MTDVADGGRSCSNSECPRAVLTSQLSGEMNVYPRTPLAFRAVELLYAICCAVGGKLSAFVTPVPLANRAEHSVLPVTREPCIVFPVNVDSRNFSFSALSTPFVRISAGSESIAPARR